MLSNTEVLKINLNKVKQVHLIGISAPFSSFCAQSLINKDIKVTASEINQTSKSAKSWVEKGVLYKGEHDSKYITKDLDFVVYPNGPIPNNPECIKADELGLKTLTVGQLTGLLTLNKKTIAVVGTHGKTTTTALIIWILIKLGLKPSYVLGDATDYIQGLDSTWNVSEDSDLFIVEACEYKKQFLQRAPNPYISVVTHIDLDHTDYYLNQKNYNDAFYEFLKNTKQALIIDSSKPNEKEVIERMQKSKPNLKIIDLKETQITNIDSTLLGDHNYQNNLRALNVGLELGYDLDEIKKALKSFKGVSKRFEYLGTTKKGNPVYRDYAHNPNKIKALLQGAKQAYPHNQIVLIFEPHSKERVFTFKDAFCESIEKADTVILAKIFSPTREPEEHKRLITSENFAHYLMEHQKNTKIVYCETEDFILATIKTLNKKSANIVFIIASAGKLQNLGDKIVQTSI